MHVPLLAVGIVCAAAVLALAVIVKLHPYLAVDDSVDRAIQSVDWGPLNATFPVFRFLGGPGGGPLLSIGAIVLAVLVNRRGWLLALAVTAGGVWYPVLAFLVQRPRPTLVQVSHITEHPGATSFPSGHVIYIALSVSLLMLCIGQRYLPRWAQVAGWVLVAAIVVADAIGRVYVGAHWPSDVLAGILIAAGWVSLVTAFRWISDRALEAA